MKKNRVKHALSNINESLAEFTSFYNDCFSAISSGLEQQFEDCSSLLEYSKQVYDNTFENKGLIKQIKELQVFIETMQNKFSQHESEILQTSENIGNIVECFDDSKDPLGEIIGNYSELKELFESINLTNKSFGKNIKGFSVEETNSLLGNMAKTESTIPVFQENMYNISQYAKRLNDSLVNMHEVFLPQIMQLLDKANDYLKLFEQHYSKFNNYKAVSKLSQKCSNDCSEILSKTLIIKENSIKLNGLANTHEKISNELDKHLNGNSLKNNNNHAYAGNMSIILEVEALQLLLTQKRTSKVIKSTSVLFNSLENGVKEIRKENELLNQNNRAISSDTTTLLKEIFLDIFLLVNKYWDNYLEIQSDIEVITNATNKLKSWFKEVDIMDSNIERKVIDKLTLESFLNSPDEKISGKSEEIFKIFAKIHYSKTLINRTFNFKMREIATFNKHSVLNKFSFRSCHTLKHLIEKTEQIFCSFSNKKNSIDTLANKISGITNETLILCNNISSKINCFNDYERHIEELILKIYTIGSGCINGNNNSIKNTKHISLNEVEKKFTNKLKNIFKSNLPGKEVFAQFLL